MGATLAKDDWTRSTCSGVMLLLLSREGGSYPSGCGRLRDPGRAPPALDPGQRCERQRGQRGEDQKAGLITAGDLLGEAEARCEIEAAEPAGHADQSGDDAHLGAESLRRELKDRAIAHAEREHADEQHAKSKPKLRQAETDDDESGDGDAIENGENAGAAEPVGYRAADRPHERAGEDASCSTIARRHRVELVLRIEIDAERRGEPGKAAERHRVVEHEPPRGGLTQDVEILGERPGGRTLRAVLGEGDVDDQREKERDRRQADDVPPAEDGGQARRKERGENRAGIARARYAERRALIFGRVPS